MIIKEEIIAFVDRANSRFTILAEIFNHFEGCTVSDLSDPGGIEFTGTEYWKYGGSENHCFYYDWDYFTCSDEEFEVKLGEAKEEQKLRLVAKEIAIKQAAENKELEKKVKELETLRELQEKYKDII